MTPIANSLNSTTISRLSLRVSKFKFRNLPPLNPFPVNYFNCARITAANYDGSRSRRWHLIKPEYQAAAA